MDNGFFDCDSPSLSLKDGLLRIAGTVDGHVNRETNKCDVSNNLFYLRVYMSGRDTTLLFGHKMISNLHIYLP